MSVAEGGRKRQFQKNLDDYRAGRVPNEEEVRSLRSELSRSIRQSDWTTAEAALAKLESLMPEEDRPGLGMSRFRILLGRGAYDAASTVADKLGEAKPDGPMMLNQLAWEVAIRPSPGKRELAVSEKAALRANELTQGNNAEILDTLARIVFLEGHPEAAINYQQQAVQCAPRRRKSQIQASLDSYRAGKLPKAD